MNAHVCEHVSVCVSMSDSYPLIHHNLPLELYHKLPIIVILLCIYSIVSCPKGSLIRIGYHVHNGLSPTRPMCKHIVVLFIKAWSWFAPGGHQNPMNHIMYREATSVLPWSLRDTTRGFHHKLGLFHQSALSWEGFAPLDPYVG